MTKAFCTLIVLCTISFAIGAQETVKEDPIIIVSGHAEKKVTPNEIYINVYMVERFEGKTKITIEDQQSKLVNLLAENGLGNNDLTMAGGKASYVKIPWKTKKDVLASTNYEIVVKTADEAAIVFEAVDELDISNCYIDRVDHSEKESIKKEVRIQAMKDAMEKADYMLEAVGSKRGPTVHVMENLSHSGVNVSSVMRASRNDADYYYMDGVKSKQQSFDVSFKKIEIEVDVMVKFEILNP